MKKLVAAMLSLFLLTGCGLAERDRAKVQESVSSDFTTTAELNYHGVDATMTILGQGAEKRYTLAFTQRSQFFQKRKHNVTHLRIVPFILIIYPLVILV